MEKTYTINQVKEAIACLNEKSTSADPDVVDLATLIYAYSRPDKEAKLEERFKQGQNIWFMHNNKLCESAIEVTFSIQLSECFFEGEYITLKRDEIYNTKEELIASL